MPVPPWMIRQIALHTLPVSAESVAAADGVSSPTIPVLRFCNVDS